MYIRRIVISTLKRYLGAFPVVGLTGPRQSGKSTLLQHALKDYDYVSFDVERNVLSFDSDPEGFIMQYKNKVIFDEVQYVPSIFNIIKVLVDKDRKKYGRYVLTSSSQFYFLKNVSESLAGRIGLMSLLPLQYSEMPKALLDESIFRGGYPELVLRNYSDADLWFSSYIGTYLRKDVNALINIGDQRSFRQLIQLLAASISQTLDMTRYSKALGVSVPTIKRWISVLEASYIIFLLPPYYENYGKRIVKSPKIYFYDMGLVSFLTGITTYDLYDKGPLAGAMFENYIVSEVIKKELHQATQADLYFLRTQDKSEIDLIVDRKQSKDFIEIKKSASFSPRMATALKKYAIGKCRKIILYNGEAYRYGDVEVINYKDYL